MHLRERALTAQDSISDEPGNAVVELRQQCAPGGSFETGLKLRRFSKRCAAKLLIERSVVLGVQQQASQLPSVPNLEHSRVFLSKQSDAAFDSRSENRDPSRTGLADHVGATFHARCQYEQVTLGDTTSGASVGELSEPVVAWIVPIFSQGKLRKATVHRAANMGYADSRFRGQRAHSHRAAQRVLDRTKVADDADVKVTLE